MTTETKAKNPAQKAKKAPTSHEATKGKLYAVFATGGKQYRVEVGDRVKIEKLAGDEHKEGDKLTFDQVLLTDNGAGEVNIGKPTTGGEIKATLSKIARYKTVDVIKYKQKSRYFKKYGHRQPYFEVTVDSIK